MSPRILLVLAALVLGLAVPFLLKPRQNLLASADETIVIISPHNEAVRHEFSVAFARHYQNKTGRSIRIDWRLPGGTSEISRFLAGEYLAAFEYAWTSQGKTWTPELAAFDNSKVKLPDDPAADTPEQAVRGVCLNASTGSAIVDKVGAAFVAGEAAALNNRIRSACAAGSRCRCRCCQALLETVLVFAT